MNFKKKSEKKIDPKKDYKLENNPLKKFWKFIWYDDSLMSYVLNLLVAFVFIKYIFFPVIGFGLNNNFPIVAIVSGSMEHKIVDHRICDKYIAEIENKRLNIEEWWNYCGDFYEKNYNFTLGDFKQFDYSNGLNIGDVMILYGKNPENIEIGEVLVFIPQDKMSNGQSRFFVQNGPVIHRIVNKYEENQTIYFQTKGDHNPGLNKDPFETKIPQEDVIAVGVFKVPFIGYAKIALNNILSGISSLF